MTGRIWDDPKPKRPRGRPRKDAPKPEEPKPLIPSVHPGTGGAGGTRPKKALNPGMYTKENPFPGTKVPSAEAHQARMAEIRERSNEPFIKLLSALIGAEPTPAALKAWAKRSPDKWAAAIVSISRLIGYGERGFGVRDPAEDLAGKSDAELRQLAGLLSTGKATILVDVTPSVKKNGAALEKVVDVPPTND